MNTPKTKWTAGKWEVRTVGVTGKVVREVKMPHGEANTYQSVIHQADGYRIVCRLDFGYGHEEDAANAQLIALAPELAEVLSDLLNLTNERAVALTPEWEAELDAKLVFAKEQARALIAKLPK